MKTKTTIDSSLLQIQELKQEDLLVLGSHLEKD